MGGVLVVGDNYYLLSALPSLGELGSVPPLSPVALLEKSSTCGSTATPQLRMLFLASDLLQREAYLAGEIEEVEGLYLSEEQLRNEAPLPSFLEPRRDEQEASGRLAVDHIWDAYFRETHRVSRKGSFLSRWVGYEVALRNALAAARAKALDLDPSGWLVAPDLAAEDFDFSNVLNEWSSASTPAAGLRVLDAARWEWAMANDDWFTFSDDEVTSYAAKLMLLQRWHTLSKHESESGVHGH
ncbi:MAG: DUF2764 family protein [Planctomycetota bacterium]